MLPVRIEANEATKVLVATKGDNLIAGYNTA